MSPPSHAPQNTSPPASVRSNAAPAPGQGAALQPSALPRDDVTPKSLSQTGRSKTVPNTIDHIWTSTVDQPQLSERDSIFATTYLASDSPAQSPRFAARPTGTPTNEHAQENGSTDVAAPGSPLTALTDSRRPSDSPPTPTAPRALPTTHGHSSATDVSDMRLETPRQSQASFISPIEASNYRPVAPQHQQHPVGQPALPSPQEALAENDESKTERARNRAWREGKLVSPHAALERPRESHVDKKIEATIPKPEQPQAARSRKASHFLRVFKEKDAAEEQQQKREGRARDRRPTSKVLQPHHEVEALLSSINEVSVHGEQFPRLSQNSSVMQSPQHRPLESYFEKVPTPGSDVETSNISKVKETQESHQDTVRRPQIPIQLLEEIRSHNLTPGANRGGSFSKSLPTAAAERLRAHPSKDRPAAQAQEPSDYFQVVRDDSEERSPGSEEDESEREHISSALYFPHRQFKSPENAPPEEETRKAEIKEIRRQSSIVAGKGPKGWDAEQAVKTPQEVEISLQSQDTNQYLHGDIAKQASVQEGKNKALASAPAEATTSLESDYESLAESSHSIRDDESSATDDLGTTPTATPRKEAKPTAPPQPLSPLGAVELKPYDHQVGGHTTVYRFSRKAVCKQLNNRENEFYETVERHHPELLEFLPRYIGVLNVTYRKAPKRKKTHKDKANADSGTALTAPPSHAVFEQASGGPSHKGTTEDLPRLVSHSQQNTAVPQVIFENNRHIIPENLFQVPPRSVTPDPWGSLPSHYHRRNQSDIGFTTSGEVTRPPMHQHSSWGVTTINTQLQEEVLRQVFAPPPIHHRQRGHGMSSRKLRGDHQGFAGSAPSIRRNSTDVTALHFPAHQESTRKQVLKAEAHRQNPDAEDHVASGSLPDDDPRRETGVVTLPRRRHSGGGLTRRPCSVDSHRRHNLEFYEEEGYGGDGEEELFVMDEDSKNSIQSNGVKSHPPSTQEATNQQQDATAPLGSMLPAPVIPKSKKTPPMSVEPINPEVAQQQPDERVQHFLLLEDLTADMAKPCVLDLKMGTRQYGVEADDKKQRSQRRKCQMTTSQQLGVRICGMQIWNVKTQSYIFEDKYFGRDLKAGKEFQDSLKRFFWDGKGYKAASRHIPLILEKISALEGMIKRLPGYRFYASSLLMLYDCGDSDQKDRKNDPPNIPSTQSTSSTDDSSMNTSRPPSPGPTSKTGPRGRCPIKLKIVDFANCVTAEDPLPEDARCPPHDPNGVDRGYLRGLRTLRLYFQRIWRDINEKEWVERGEGEGMSREIGGPGLGEVGPGWMDDAGNEDTGNVSM